MKRRGDVFEKTSSLLQGKTVVDNVQPVLTGSVNADSTPIEAWILRLQPNLGQGLLGSPDRDNRLIFLTESAARELLLQDSYETVCELFCCEGNLDVCQLFLCHRFSPHRLFVQLEQIETLQVLLNI